MVLVQQSMEHTARLNSGFYFGENMFGKPPTDTDKKISILTDLVTELTVTVKTMAVEHKTISQDQDILFKKVDKNGEEIRNLQNTGARIDTVSNLAKYGGIGLIAAIFGSWNSLSDRVELATAKTEANAQSIVQLKADSEDTQKQLTDVQKRVTDNREAILSAVRDAKNRGDLK